MIFYCDFGLHFHGVTESEHLYRYLLVIFLCSLEKCLFNFSTHFKIGLFVFSTDL